MMKRTVWLLAVIVLFAGTAPVRGQEARAKSILIAGGTLIDGSDARRRWSPPIGISHVLVHGRLVVEGGKVTGERPGKVLRHSSKR